MYPAVDVAIDLLKVAASSGYSLTPMQVQKLVYIAHGISLAQRGLPLINEKINAWQYGPVIPEIYGRFRNYQSQPIPLADLPESTRSSGIDTESLRILEDVVRNFARLSGGQLSELSHRVGSPWHSVWFDQKGHEVRGAIIPDSLIRPHYQQILHSGRVECL
ncbi:Panacea domain-containing protein [Rheinheimera marina]|uniref:Panacea domain-containing protein n=1 Tax=Rheinheimera marina TaxID=1774958 RepID=A0ABV9JKY9_9GAMM